MRSRRPLGATACCLSSKARPESARRGCSTRRGPRRERRPARPARARRRCRARLRLRGGAPAARARRRSGAGQGARGPSGWRRVPRVRGPGPRGARRRARDRRPVVRGAPRPVLARLEPRREPAARARRRRRPLGRRAVAALPGLLVAPARRVAALVVAAVRTGDPSTDEALLGELTSDPAVPPAGSRRAEHRGDGGPDRRPGRGTGGGPVRAGLPGGDGRQPVPGHRAGRGAGRGRDRSRGRQRRPRLGAGPADDRPLGAAAPRPGLAGERRVRARRLRAVGDG